ncbi:PKD1L3 [Branchiostoma lanceolatum]|uniref:PKD1L3 protein n=1 Tax=Branchiostoma lanceolatum TaxID=7740 RepID=A0A8K0EE63_BRALA|nr:PKD1L3 [Branchiostoma lanceolatum]
MKKFMELVVGFFLAILAVHHMDCSPCKPSVDQVCSCKDGLLSSSETCTVCSCSQDGNYGKCKTSQWLNIPASWILEESSGASSVGFASNAFDGDASTVWEPLDQPHRYQHWVILDLQTSFTIHRVTITNNGDGVHDIVSFIMESSVTSPYVWTTAYSSDAVLPEIFMPQHFKLHFVGRYMRLKVNTQNGVRPILREVALYGKENTGDPEVLSCPVLNTGCIISDTAVETAPPGGQDCYVTADIYEGLQSIAEPLQVHRSGHVHLHGDVSVECEDDFELQIFWTVRGYNQTTPEEAMDEILPNGTPRNDIDLEIAPKTLPLGVHLVQFQVVMNVPGRSHVSVSAAQTWVEFLRVPVVYSLGSAVRTVPTDGDVVVRADSSYDPEELMPSSRFTYNWTCRVTNLPAASTCAGATETFIQDPSWVVDSSGTPWVTGGVTYDAGKTLDGDTGTFWNPLGTAQYSSQNMVLNLRLPYSLTQVALNNYGDVVHDISAFTLQKSQVGIPYVWEDVLSIPNVQAGTSQRQEFGGFQETAQHWRFVVTQTASGWQPYLRELDFYGIPDPSGVENIDIPAGLNVAEGRRASTNHLPGWRDAWPEKAVDGNTNTNIFLGSCLHTEVSQPDPWVHIDLCHRFSINRIVIYNRMDSGPWRNNPFNLHLGNSSDILQNPTWDSCYLLGCVGLDSHPGVLVFDSPLDSILLPNIPRPAGLVAELSVEITAGDLPPQMLRTVLYVAPNDTLPGLDLQCEENCDPWKTLSTQPLSLYTDSEILGTSEFSLVEFPPDFPGQQWTPGTDSVTANRLSVLGGTFWVQGYYTIRLTDHHIADCGDFSRFAEWRFNIQLPPAPRLESGDGPTGSSAPSCTLMPMAGVSLIDHFCVVCPGFVDILGPVEVTIWFQLTPSGEVATATFPGDGPAGDNKIFITASSRFWIDYTPQFDLAVGTIQLFVRAESVDGRFFEYDLPPIEVSPPTVSQLQSYLEAFFAYPDGLFFRQLALGDTESAFKGVILASAATGHLAHAGYDVLELVDMITEALSMVRELKDVESINGVSLSLLLSTTVPEMVSGKSLVLAATSLRSAFERTRELAGNTTEGVTPVDVVTKLAAFMFSATVNVMSASSMWAEKDHLAGKSFSPNLVYSQEATMVSFQALDIMDDIYLNKLMPQFADPEIFADISMTKVHVRIKRENRTRFAERVYHVRGDSDCLVRVPSFPGLLGDSCIDDDTVGIQFLESNFNPYEYSNNSNEIQADVAGLGVKCGNRTLPIAGLTEPIDILTRRKNDSLAESFYVFQGLEPVGNMAVFQFFVRKKHSALSLSLEFHINSTLFPQNVSLFLHKEEPPTPTDYNWTTTLPVPDSEMVSISWMNGTNLTSYPYHWLVPAEEIAITNDDVDNMTDYFIGVRLDSELGSGDIVNFTLRVFETSCVYFHEDFHLWQSDGCEVGLMSNTSHIHCRCNHLTKFSGFVAPNPLNIAEALSANVLENPAGLVLVLTVFGMYLMGILWARKSDRRDLVKAGIGILPGHKLNPRKDCQYVITVYTGFKGNAGTTAEVTIVLCSQDNESPPFTLSDQKRILFEKGSVDSFLVSTPQPLGALRYICVWHNNGGYSPGWFLSQIVVTNRGDNTPNFFLCNRDMNDGHLWFSVAGRPARSPFTRVQRLSCCLTLLYSTMITNIMFFGRGDDFDPPEPVRIGGIEINPPISLPQMMIGLQSAAIIMPVNLLIVFLFRNSGSSSRSSKKGPKTKSRTKMSSNKLAKYLPQKKWSEKETAKRQDEPCTMSMYDPECWLLVCSASFVAAFFTVLYTLSFGRAKAEAWLVTFLTSFLTDLFLIQPFKLMLVAVLFALIAKKPVEDEDPAPEPLHQDEEYLEEDKQVVRTDSMHWQTATGWMRYLWTEESKTLDHLSGKTQESAQSKSPPTEYDLEKQRADSLERLKRRNQILEVLIFGLFLTVIMVTSYGERSPLAFYVTKNVQRLLLESGDIGFSEIKDIPSFWTWVTTGLVPAIHAAQWYNGRGSIEAMVMPDMLTYPLGPVQLRQVRLTPGKHCEPPKRLERIMPRCTVAYSLDVADTHNFTDGWNTTANATGSFHCISPRVLTNTTESPGKYNCLKATNPWSYTYASVTDGFPYFGKGGTYLTGGYVTSLGSTDQTSLARAAYLQQHDWLDDQSRAVFMELTLYNPHVNLFSVVSMAAEFTNLGVVYKGSEVVTLRLIQHDAILLLVLRGCLALFILYFALREGKVLISRPLEYLAEFWSWVELLVIAVGFSALGVYFHTQSIIDEVAEKRAAGNSTFSGYKSAVGWFQIYTYLLGLLISCATLKFVRILRFNSHVYALSMTMRRSLKPVGQFMLTVGILIMAFTQMANLIFGVKLVEYKNITSSLQSLLFMMLGSFDFEALTEGHNMLGPLMFFMYQTMMQFFLLSMFMAIIMDVYAEETQSTNMDELNFHTFVKESALRTLKKVKDKKSPNVDVKKNTPTKDRGTLADMLMKIDRMVGELDTGVYD